MPAYGYRRTCLDNLPESGTHPMNYPELPGKIRHDICEWWKTVHQNGDQPWRQALEELKAKDEFPLLKLGVDLLEGRVGLDQSLASENFVERRVAEIVRDFKGS